MIKVRADSRWCRRVGLVGVVAVATLLYVLRRPDELLAPYPWAEEGLIIQQWQFHGWATIFHPVAGELMPLTAGGIVLAGHLSWGLLPALDYAMSVVTFVATATMLVVPRSRFGSLPVRAAMLLAIIAVPSDAEVYGVMLLSFWWTTLWPLIMWGWTGPAIRLRPALALLAALNSLAGAALIVIYVPLLFRRRTRELTITTGLMALGGVAQAIAYLTSPRAATSVRVWDVLRQTFINTSQYCLRPLFGARVLDPTVEAALGLVLMGLLLAGVLAIADRSHRLTALGLLGAWLVLSGLSSAAAPLEADPVLAGPRYFFLPFGVLAVLLVFLVARIRTWKALGLVDILTAALALLMIGYSLIRLPTVYVRHSDHLSWRQANVACAQHRGARYDFPVQRDGHAADVWTQFHWKTSVCRAAIRHERLWS